jgi:Txe/YoeB family toxin of Txe-Axe toxin-antitoxin module
MRYIVYEPDASDDLEYWASTNLKTLKKVIELIHSCRKSRLKVWESLNL